MKKKIDNDSRLWFLKQRMCVCLFSGTSWCVNLDTEIQNLSAESVRVILERWNNLVRRASTADHLLDWLHANNMIDLRDVGVPSVSSRGWGCMGGRDREVSLIGRVVYGDHIFLFWRM
jgi:hypothetical protein